MLSFAHLATGESTFFFCCRVSDIKYIDLDRDNGVIPFLPSDLIPEVKLPP